MGIIEDAGKIVDSVDRTAALTAIEQIISEHPNGEYLFISVEPKEDGMMVMNTYSSADFPVQSWLASSFLHTLHQDVWYPVPEPPEEE